MLFRRRLKLGQTQEELDAQAEKFLLDYDFPVDPAHLALFGQFVQQAPSDSDVIDTKAMASAMRKAKATSFAFYLIKPDRRPKPEPTPDAAPLDQTTKD